MRKAQPGWIATEATLCPIGDRGLKENVLEYQGRRDAEATKVPVADIAAFVKSKLGTQ